MRMDKAQLDHLVTSAGMNLLNDHAPRFLVSLRVGLRIQCATLTFGTVQAFEQATTDQTVTALALIKSRLERAAKTQQGDVAQGGEVAVETPVLQVAPSGIQYPAH
jgi:hypothetical protein